jgi:heme-degrading monooxygenase HmoA
MFARIASYQFKPGTATEVARKAGEGLAPIYRKHAGFHSYQVILTGTDTGYSVSTWESEAQARAAVNDAAAWVKANVAEQIVATENHVGSVAFSHNVS